MSQNKCNKDKINRRRMKLNKSYLLTFLFNFLNITEHITLKYQKKYRRMRNFFIIKQMK